MMRLYLDLCCFNRPSDDQGQTRVRLETAAKLDRVLESEGTRALARLLASDGIKSYDALHAACAVAGEAALFVSTDDALLKRLKTASSLKAVLPGEALAIVENWYED